MHSTLRQGPSGCHFLFSAHDDGPDKTGAADVLALAAIIRARVDAAGPAGQAWAGRLHFTHGSASDSLGPLYDLLAQWKTPQNIIQFPGLNVSRLDMEYATGGWPSQNEAITLTNTPACSSTADNKSFAFVTLEGAPLNCTASKAAAAALKAGAKGAVIAQRNGQAPVPIGRKGSGDGGKAPGGEQVVTMISYEDGVKVSKLLLLGGGTGKGQCNATFASPSRVGEMTAIDHDGFLAEVGWQKDDTLGRLHTIL